MTRRAVLGLLVAGLAGSAAAETGPNLLVGIEDETGYCTDDPAASTTVPGWTVEDGTPAILCSTVPGFEGPVGKSVISGGPYGDSSLSQPVDVSEAAGAIDGGGVSFTLSGSLGGWQAGTAEPELSPSFLGAGPAIRLPPVTATDRNGRTTLIDRGMTGTVPPGTRTIVVRLRFSHTKGDLDVGFADHLSLTLSAPVEPKPLTPPPSTVPAFDHVFLIMMENTDYGQIIGDARNAPFVNGLLDRGTLLARYNAVYHPSDENYLAIAAGDTLVKGGQYFPDVHLTAPHIGDVLEAHGKSWKTYEQGMGTPCNTTTKFDKHFEPDDTPFINFSNVRDNPARCRAHLVDTTALTTDLKAAATTPNFAWIAADAYYDGEDSGNGSPQSLRAQDRWLKTTLTALFAAPAWRDERSLLILTWDESNATANNHIATFVLGSQGLVRTGAVSQILYDHYSTARTIEEALGLPPMTANDRYARPINDAFEGR